MIISTSYVVSETCSGLLLRLTQDMILQQMLFIQLFHASQEGTENNIIF